MDLAGPRRRAESTYPAERCQPVGSWQSGYPISPGGRSSSGGPAGRCAGDARTLAQLRRVVLRQGRSGKAAAGAEAELSCAALASTIDLLQQSAQLPCEPWGGDPVARRNGMVGESGRLIPILGR